LGGGFLDRGNALLRAWPSAAALPAVTASAAEDPVGPASSIPHTDGLDSLLAELRDPETTPPRRLHIGDLLEMWEPDGDPRPGVGTVVAERQKSPRGARRYYNSEDADDIYFHLGGGEDIHIGLYQHVDDEITDASRRTVDFIADRLAAVLSKRNARVIDLGSGYGSAARTLAKRFGCRVLSLNLSEAENARNRQMNADAGLEHLIEVVGGSFEQIPVEDGSFDVAWSQDAILHSARREKVLEEIDRVLKPGGEFAFTDPMQVDDCPDGVLQPVLERMHLSSLGSFAAYRLQAQRLGWEEVAVIDMTDQLVTHYGRVAALLRAEGESLTAKVSDGYIERILQGLQHWIDAGRNGYLAWGLLHFRKPLYASEQSAEDDLGIRVVTVDDHSLLRAMVRQVLEEEQGFVIVGGSRRWSAGSRSCSQAGPGCRVNGRQYAGHGWCSCYRGVDARRVRLQDSRSFVAQRFTDGCTLPRSRWSRLHG
jgi:sarcosine/dimethylglycine N-methyltransferase